MESQGNQIAPKKKGFWKMVKTIFLPAQSVVRLMTGCGGGRSRKVKRQLSVRNMRQARDLFLRSTIQSPNSTSAPVSRTSNDPVELMPGHPLSSPTTPPSIPPPPIPNTSTDFYSTDEISIYSPLSPTFPTTYESPRISNDVTSMTTAASENATSINSPSPASRNLPAPLNLEEAQVLLESLALSTARGGQNESSPERESWGEQIVNVDIEPEPISASVRDSAENFSFHYHHNHRASYGGDHAYIYENISDRNKSRLEMASTPRLNSINLNNNGEDNHDFNYNNNDDVSLASGMRRSRTSASLSMSYSSYIDGDDFHGWRRSSIEVSSKPPVTLAFIPSGLCVGDRVVWVQQDDHPEIGTVRWIGKIRNEFYAGVEFDKPVGNSSGIYGYGVGMYKRLFTCQLPYGRFVPVHELILYKDYHDTGVKSGIVCIICRDDFLDTNDPDSSSLSSATNNNNNPKDDIQTANMVSTKCGHLFHWGCLDHWFSTNKKRTDFHCPFCLRSMGRDEVIRIFPSQI